MQPDSAAATTLAELLVPTPAPTAPAAYPAPIWPFYDEDQIAAVAEVLRSGCVNAWTGPDVGRFETTFADYVGSPHAIALANGSVSLTVALDALELEPGDEVIVTPRSFVISASAVILAGGRPVFADVDPDTQNITPATIAPLITERTVGIIPVHLAGWPCDMAGIMALARRHKLWVVEDCAQAHGARIGGRHVGTFGHFGSFSFCQDKIMTTGGEGGMLVTNDAALWRRAWSRKDHGKDYDLVHAKDHPPGFRWLHAHPGSNLRMSGPAAALGTIQVSRMADWHSRRARSAAILARAFLDCPALRVPMPRRDETHAWYRFYAFVRPDRLRPGWSRDRILSEIARRGETAFSGSCPEIYNEQVFRQRGFAPGRPLPTAAELGRTSLAFRVDPTLDDAAMERTAKVVCEVMASATA
ncbi:dTDP-4-amino-4,6-dideoxygalactose transaminase [Palleronia marisminoris]|uniref:dTDP-3-amino-3, 6-dideoxy-alpha-D-galactopyranose transaminase n=1 Tax=Palleronia marisminoris TaxID=315423 RepID=A0A1Y5SA90_9RHOB|nr:DegT/DnrJ/EryC1/StrS aminotransferase family protein [Palleronia marisminoris]SFG68326.1 dTDP-4-amino-4,6-dideoxygalactose transaminase [Palleronia marisminoris]SLN34921.1 dTDP-3-amino-3, 6-dideoxy-alpha-D-galactopyranose transaminase [Palleronia marisminoris]